MRAPGEPRRSPRHLACGSRRPASPTSSVRRLGIALALAALPLSCSEVAKIEAPAHFAVSDATSSNAPLRLTEAVATRRAAFPARGPGIIPLDDRWTADSGAMPILSPKGITLSSVEGAPVLLRQLSRAVRLERFGELRLVLQASAGDTCTVRWQGDLEPQWRQHPGIAVPIIADGTPHTYRVPLAGRHDLPMLGQIQKLAVRPSDVACDATLSELAFLPADPATPQRVTLGGRTLEALTGGPLDILRIPWRVKVPKKGVLDFAYGIAPAPWLKANQDGVTFRIDSGAMAGQDAALFEKHVPAPPSLEEARWMDGRLDLAEHAGETIDLLFSIDGGASSVGDYAFWGNPIIHGGKPRKAATPVLLISVRYGARRPSLRVRLRAPHLAESRSLRAGRGRV